MIHINLLQGQLASERKARAAAKARRYRAKHPEYARKVNARYRARHAERAKQAHREWYYSEAGLASHLRRRYNITLNEYKELLVRQDGVCAGCSGPPVSHGKNRGVFCVDHDHATGRVRGLLCYNCNVLLGHAKDNSETLKKLLAYLEK